MSNLMIRMPHESNPSRHRVNARSLPYLAVGLAFLACLLGCNSNESSENSQRLLESRPSAELTPEAVVAIQIESIRSGNPAGFETAYRFASPKQQILAGPSTRFRKIMNREPYLALQSAARIDYFDVEIDDAQASQIVQCVGENGEVTFYLFKLTRQGAGEFTGCWLTESVTCSEIQFQAEESDAVVR